VDILDPAGGKVTGVVLRDVVTGARSERRADGVFVAIGHLPNTAIFRGQVDLLPSGYVRVEPERRAPRCPACSPQATRRTPCSVRR